MPQTVLTHVHEDELTLYVNGRLAPDRVLDVETHLANCGECKHRLDQTLHFITKLADLRNRQHGLRYLEKRREPRFPSDSAISLQVLRPLSFDRLTGRITNVSRSGVAVVLNRALERGTLVQVRVGVMVLLGEVRHCARTGKEFTIGVLLEDVMV